MKSEEWFSGFGAHSAPLWHTQYGHSTVTLISPMPAHGWTSTCISTASRELAAA